MRAVCWYGTEDVRVVIDAVGMEASDGLLGSYHRAKQSLHLEQDRAVALTEAIMACTRRRTSGLPHVSGRQERREGGAETVGRANVK